MTSGEQGGRAVGWPVGRFDRCINRSLSTGTSCSRTQRLLSKRYAGEFRRQIQPARATPTPSFNGRGSEGLWRGSRLLMVSSPQPQRRRQHQPDRRTSIQNDVHVACGSRYADSHRSSGNRSDYSALLVATEQSPGNPANHRTSPHFGHVSSFIGAPFTPPGTRAYPALPY